MTTEPVSSLLLKAMLGSEPGGSSRVVWEQVSAVLPGRRYLVGGDVLATSGRSPVIRSGDLVAVLHEGGKRTMILGHNVLKAQFHPAPEVEPGDFQTVSAQVVVGGVSYVVISSFVQGDFAIRLSDFGVPGTSVFYRAGFCQNNSSIVWITHADAASPQQLRILLLQLPRNRDSRVLSKVPDETVTILGESVPIASAELLSETIIGKDELVLRQLQINLTTHYMVYTAIHLSTFT